MSEKILEQCDKERKKRTVKRRLFTLSMNKLEVLINSVPLEVQLVKSQLDIVNNILSELESLDSTILELCLQLNVNEDDLVNEISDTYERMNKRNSLQIKFESLCASMAPNRPNSSNPPPVARPVLLPKIKLPKFSGNIIEFQTFWEQFESAVHNDNTLSNIQKLTFLRSCLEGEAAKLVSKVPNIGSSYESVIKTLKDNYDDKHIKTIAHVNHFLGLFSPTYTKDALSNFRSEYEAIYGSIPHDFETLFICIILAKLPEEFSTSIRRACADDLFKIQNFNIAMQQEIKLLPINCETLFNSNNQVNDDQAVQPLNFIQNEIQSTANFKVGTNKKTWKLKNCRFCDSPDHTSRYCTVYTDVLSRQNRLRERGGICFKCWMNKHDGECMKFTCQNCSGNHWVAVCKQQRGSVVSTNKINVSNSGNCVTQVKTRRPIVAIPTLNLSIKQTRCSRKPHMVRVLLDQGSQITLITESVVRRLNLKESYSEVMEISGYNNREIKSFKVVEFNVVNAPNHIQVQAAVVPSITNVVVPSLELISRNLEEKGIQLAENSFDEPIEILIGGDYYYDFVDKNKLCLTVDGIDLIPTTFGNYLVTGKLTNTMNNNSFSSFKISVVDKDLSLLEFNKDKSVKDIELLWRMDSVGITDDTCDKSNVVLQNFNDKIQKIGNRYQVELPWKSLDNTILPNNFHLAKGRLNSLTHRFRKDSNLFSQYKSVLKDQLDKGFIEVIPFEDIDKELCHYIPHHPIIRNHPTTPIRIVFDCSAKCSKQDPSLNDMLHTGPNMVPELTKILLRFRVNEFACLSDISKAFLQVFLHPKDRDFTRFLFIKDASKSPLDHNNLLFYRFKVVLFGATSSPFLLSATIKHHLDDYAKCNDKDVSYLHRDLYVDNLFFTSKTENELINFFNEAVNCYNEAGFSLREWSSNSRSLNTLIEQNKLGPKDKVSDIKVLGLLWNKLEDTLHLPEVTYSTENLTKRKIVSDTAKLFDPLGLFSALTNEAKLIIQELWKSKVDWDEIVSRDICIRWNLYVKLVNNIHLINFPRFIIASEVVLHCFADSSETCYGCVCYAVSNHKSNLLFSKTRVAPLKRLTIPRLELTAILLSVRMAKYVVNSLKEISSMNIKHIYFWSDSSCSLSWISSDRKFDCLFVKNRVNEINSITAEFPSCSFNFIEGINNPADLLTRSGNFKDLDEFMSSFKWWHGPKWLVGFPESRNSSNYINNSNCLSSNNSIVINNSISENSSLSIKSINVQPVIYTNNLPNIDHFSNYLKLLHSTIYVFRFCKIFKIQGNIGLFQAWEIVEAENIWIKEIQSKHYDSELTYFKSSSIEKIPQLVKQLRLKLDDGILRISTRLELADLDKNIIFPILLPYNSRFTELLIMHYHVTKGHLSASQVMIAIRQRFWIIKCKNTINKTLNRCTFCRRYRVSNYVIPTAPPLPSYRITKTSAFNHCGVDYTGAMYVKNNKVVRKVYLVLFTCPVTRAVHLELASDMTAIEFSLVFRRFISRRGMPAVMYSDNGSNFHGHTSILEYLYDNVFHSNRIAWNFIPPYASWYGSIWERLIGLTKNHIYKKLGKSLLNYDQLHTAITEIEARLNDRPISYMHEDQLNHLSPSQLMLGRRLDALPVPESYNYDRNYGSNDSLNKGYLKLLSIIDHCWLTWKSSYLLFLKDQERLNIPTGVRQGKFHASIGDVVLIADKELRSQWTLGLIVELLPGKDNEIRIAKVKTKNGYVLRSLVKLHFLETSNMYSTKDSIKINNKIISADSNITDSVNDKRPMRQSANKMLDKLSQWSRDNLI